MKGAIITLPENNPDYLPVAVTKIGERIAALDTPDQCMHLLAATDGVIGFAKTHGKTIGSNHRETLRQLAVHRFDIEDTLGRLLAALPKATGGQPYRKNPTGSKSEPVDATLSELGIDKKTSMRAQQITRLPAKIKTRIRHGELTVAAALAGLINDAARAEHAAQVLEKAASKRDTRLAELEAENARLQAAYDDLQIRYDDLNALSAESIDIAEAMKHLKDNTHVKKIAELEHDLRLMKQARDDYQTESKQAITQYNRVQGQLNRMRRSNGAHP